MSALSHKPTPIEAMPNFSSWLNGPEVFIKRDDCTGLALGGNKARQLEFYMGDAISKKADSIIITGAIQSNFVRQAAAAARKLGMKIHIQLEDRVNKKDKLYMDSGNILLNKLLGAEIYKLPAGRDESEADDELDKIADQVRSRGGKPYVIHLGLNHPPLGALGYVDAAIEMLSQSERLNLVFDAIVLGSGSAATHSGFLTGLRYKKSNIPIYGICVRRPSDEQGTRVLQRVRQVEKMLKSKQLVTKADINVDDKCLGLGYGVVDNQVRDALETVARTEGILLDPVYTAKVMAGLINLTGEGVFKKGQRILFLHTGGVPALFGYANSLI